MRVIVTGSSGRLGSVTVEHLKNSGHQVIGIDLIKHASTNHLIDIQSKEDVGNILQGIDAIVHTAVLHGKHYDLNYSREAFIDVNIKGTLNLLNAAVKNGIKKFLYLSTTSIYGTAMQDEKQAVWVDETLIEQPRDIYDITKQCCEQLCKDFFYREGLATTVFRVARFLPESENLTINHRLYRGLDERDGAEAIRLALLHNFDQFEIFNISSGTPFLKEELNLLKHSPLEAILKHYPEAEEIYKKQNWIFPKSIDRVYVIEKAKEILGYQPKYTFDYLLHQ